jgi:DNA (cytosine-5)-methyltransferase 1
MIKVKSATKEGFEEASEGDSINLTFPDSETRRGRVGVGVGETLDTQCNQAVIVAQRGSNPENSSDRTTGAPTEQRLEPNSQGITNTLTSVQKDNLLQQDYSIRRLTEIEVERLQGFKDNWTAIGNYDGVIKPISKTQRYKMCGNAVTVDIVQLITDKLFKIIT